MAAPTLIDVMGLNDPAYTWKYEVTLPDLAGSAIGATAAARNSLLSGFVAGRSNIVTSLPLQHRVESITFPFSAATAKPRFYSASNVYYPDFHDVEATTLEIYEDNAYSATNYMLSWRHLVYNQRTGHYRESSLYKREVKVRAYSGVNGEGPSFEGTLQGCWPTSIAPLNYNNDSARMILSVSLSVDSSDVRFLASSRKPSKKTGKPLSEQKNLPRKIRTVGVDV